MPHLRRFFFFFFFYFDLFNMVNFTIIAGGYTAALSVFSFNSETTKLSLVGTPSGGDQPGWVQVGPDHKSLFATQEVGDGGVASFTLSATGDVTQVSRGHSSGSPASLGVLSNGKEVVVANYDVGSITSFPIGDDGVTLGDATPILQLQGSGPNPDRQTSPHPHNVVEYGDEVLIPDLGSDKVWRLVKGTSGGYEVAGSVDMVPGSGPRHAVAEDGLLYVVHELDNTLTTYTLPPLTAPSAKFRRFLNRRCPTSTSSSTELPTSSDVPTSTESPSSTSTDVTTSTDAPSSTSTAVPEPTNPPSSTPTLVSSVSIVPEDGPAGSSWGGGELVISPKGADGPRFLYASNRNVGTTDERGDPIAVASVGSDGTLAIVHEAYTGLQHVRGMALGGNNGQYIIAAGMNGGGVAIFERQEDGDLKLLDRYTGDGSQNLASFAWV